MFVLSTDYVGFIKRMMKLLQSDSYPNLRRVDLDIVPLEPCAQDAFVPGASYFFLFNLLIYRYNLIYLIKSLICQTNINYAIYLTSSR